MEGGDFTGETRVPLVEEKCQYQGKGTGGLAIQYVVPWPVASPLRILLEKQNLRPHLRLALRITICILI